jgi:hypothetical protein
MRRNNSTAQMWKVRQSTAFVSVVVVQHFRLDFHLTVVRGISARAVHFSKNGINMAAKIHWRTLLAALGIALVVETLLVRLYLWYLPGALAGPKNGLANLWLWEAIRLTQQPSLGLMQSWIGVVGPGYGELIGDMFLVPVFQWLVYAAVIYLILETYLRQSVRATRKEN